MRVVSDTLRTVPNTNGLFHHVAVAYSSLRLMSAEKLDGMVPEN